LLQPILQNDQQGDDQQHRQIAKSEGAYDPLPPWESRAPFIACVCHCCL